MATAPEPGPEASASSDAGPINTIIFGDCAKIRAPVVGRDLIIHQDRKQSTPDELGDVCQGLKTMLKSKHQKIKIPKMPWIDCNWEFPLDHYYVDLTVTPKEDNRRKLKAKTIQVNDILKPVGSKKSTRILIEGPAGYGKSMLSLKLCYDYSKEEIYMKDYELVVLIRLRDFKTSTVDEMLIEQLNLQDTSSESILQSLKKYQNSILIIFDGVDEADELTRDNLNRLLKSEYLPGSTVVVTSRPGSVSDMDNFDKRVEIKGITGANRCKFLQLHLRSCNEEKKAFLREFLYVNFNLLLDDEPVATRLFKRLKKVISFQQGEENFFDCPLFLLLIVAVAKYSYPNISLFKTKTELYKYLFTFVAQRTLSERFHQEHKVDLFLFDTENPPTYVRSLSQFGKMAINALSIKKFTFSREEILSQCNGDDVILHMGFLTENDSIDDVAGEQTIWFQPIHLSVLEFCAAFFLWYSFICQIHTFCFSYLNPFIPDSTGKVELLVFPFLVGLCGDELPSFFTTLQNEDLPHDLIACLARCNALFTASTLERNLLSESLHCFVPEVWHISSIRSESKAAAEVLKIALAEALCRRRVRCIVHDADLSWDICMGKKFAFVPMIALTINTSCDSLLRMYENVHCIELRIFMVNIPNKRWFKPDLLAKIAMVISFVDDIADDDYIRKVFAATVVVEVSKGIDSRCLRMTRSKTINIPVYCIGFERPASEKLILPIKFREESSTANIIGFYSPLPLSRRRLELLENRLSFF